MSLSRSQWSAVLIDLLEQEGSSGFTWQVLTSNVKDKPTAKVAIWVTGSRSIGWSWSSCTKAGFSSTCSRDCSRKPSGLPESWWRTSMVTGRLKFTIEIETVNDAFAEFGESEVARILDQAMLQMKTDVNDLRDTGMVGSKALLKDINGNTVGYVETESFDG